MQEALILKLIILALAVTFIAVIIALVLSFNVTQKLMKHNANLVGQVKESDEAEAQLKIAQDKINDMMRQANQDQHPDQSLQQEINNVANVADMTDEQLMDWIDAQMDKLGLYRNPDVTLKEIAQALGLTQRRVTQAIKTRKADNTLAEYLNTKRLLNGCRLLVEQPNWTIDAVAQE